jgi:hypothetical protein
MTIVFSFRSADSQYLKIHLWRKRRRERSKNKDRFLCADETIASDWFFARSCNSKNLWYLTADYFFIADSFLTADFFLTADYLALNDFYQSFFVLNASVMIVIENEDICLSHMTLLNSEFEELVCCSKRFCLCRKTRDRYWVSNSTYSCLY